MKMSNQSYLEQDHSHGTIVKLMLEMSCAEKLYEWCHTQHVTCIDPEQLHMTLLMCPIPAKHLTRLHNTPTHIPANALGWKILGENALVLDLHCLTAHQMHSKLLACNARHNFSNFIAHTSVMYGCDPEHIPQTIPDFPLLFDLVQVLPNDPNWAKNIK